MEKTFKIKRYEERYPGLGKEFPDEFTIIGLNLNQAKKLAEELSYICPGCEGLFYVDEDKEI